MCTDLAVGKIAECMSQPFCQSLYCCFTDIVGGIPRWRSDALLGSRIYDEAWLASLDHRISDALYTIEDAQNIDVEYPSPAIWIRERVATLKSRSIVHQ